jgi:hypothetical protein
MNKFVCVILFVFTSFAFAKENLVENQMAVESSVAKAYLNVDFGFDRPVIEAIHMDVSVLCKDLRKTDGTAKPQIEKLLDGEKICALHDYHLDKDGKTLTISYATGEAKGEVGTCKNHWTQEIDLKETCQKWAPQEPIVASNDVGTHDITEFSSSNRHYRSGLRHRHRAYGYTSSIFGETNWYDTDSFFGGSAVGTYPGQRRRGVSRDGLPRNSRREVIGCPGLESMGVSRCMSAIIAAESSCVTTVRHAGHGIGLCAIENDGRRHRFGQACQEIGSLSGQIACCNAMYAQQGMRYFGGRTRRIAASACGR